MVVARWEFEQWMAFGVVRGWIAAGGPVCAQHEGVPLTSEEEEVVALEDDPDAVCPFVLRVL